MGDVPTVKVRYPCHGAGADEYAIVNISDFDPGFHRPFDAENAKLLGVPFKAEAPADEPDETEAPAKPKRPRGRPKAEDSEPAAEPPESAE